MITKTTDYKYVEVWDNRIKFLSTVKDAGYNSTLYHLVKRTKTYLDVYRHKQGYTYHYLTESEIDMSLIQDKYKAPMRYGWFWNRRDGKCIPGRSRYEYKAKIKKRIYLKNWLIEEKK